MKDLFAAAGEWLDGIWLFHRLHDWLLNQIDGPMMAGVLVPMLLVGLLVLSRKLATPGGPAIWDIFFKWSKAWRLRDFVLLFDLLLAALAAQFTYLIERDRTQQNLAPSWGAFWLIVAALVLGVPYMLWIGHEKPSPTASRAVARLKEDWGVIIPSIAGIFALMTVYMVNH